MQTHNAIPFLVQPSFQGQEKEQRSKQKWKMDEMSASVVVTLTIKWGRIFSITDSQVWDLSSGNAAIYTRQQYTVPYLAKTFILFF